MATLIDGRAVAAGIREDVAAAVRELGRVGLATVLVGDDPASEIYIGHKHRAASEAGIDALDHRLPADASQEAVLGLVAELNADASVDGVLVQTPLPPHLDEPRITGAVEPVKDVDGLTPYNAGRLYLGAPTFVPATPLGIMRLLDVYGVPTAGAHAVVVGRSAIVGKPVAQLLLHGNATVTVCHSRTVDLAGHTREADILVAAVGQPAFIGADMVKEGAAVIDVGITRTEDRLVGDVDEAAASRAAYITPVPGGVGPMTIALLLENAVRAARFRRKEVAFPGG